MTKAEANALPLGLYRVYWKDANHCSLAAVGSDHKGNRWLAPCNWQNPSVPGWLKAELAQHWRNWNMVRSVELIEGIQ